MKLAVNNWPFSSNTARSISACADALRDAAMDLARQQQRIQREAEIIDDGVADDRRDPRLGIDFDFADMRAVGIGRVRRHERIRSP